MACPDTKSPPRAGATDVVPVKARQKARTNNYEATSAF